VQIKKMRAPRALIVFNALYKSCPIKITWLLTYNGKKFTSSLRASRERQPSGNYEFDVLCQILGLENRLAPARLPQTNVMFECLNSRIRDVLETVRFNCALDNNQMLLRYVGLNNH